MSLSESDLVSRSLTHPEEIKSVFEMQVGKHISMKASARITPIGVISTGIAAAVVLVAVGVMVSSIGHRARHQRFSD